MPKNVLNLYLKKRVLKIKNFNNKIAESGRLQLYQSTERLYNTLYQIVNYFFTAK